MLPVTWHDYEESCAPGVSLYHKNIWAASLGEVTDWYRDNESGATDWNLRFVQLLGMPPDGGHTRFSAFWIPPSEVIIPAYMTDVTA